MPAPQFRAYTGESVILGSTIKKIQDSKLGHNTQSDILRKTRKSNILMASSSMIGSKELRNITSAALSNSQGAFNLFTHQQIREVEGPKALVHDYASLKLAILELYLSVKVRSDEEIDNYNQE